MNDHWPYSPDLLARPVPRYTSFPTAAEFVDGLEPADLFDQIERIGADELVSLYLHIPYCRQICWYCGCSTGAANRKHRLAGYLDALGDEIDAMARRLQGRGRIGRVAWGGGSPNALEAPQFRALHRRVEDAFDCHGAVGSIELDPRGFNAEWGELIGELGISRVSLGVQTFGPHIQAAIGRVQSTELIAQVVGQLRSAGVESLNFDLMYGLPGQSEDDLRATIDQALALKPDRLAVFGYAHVPHMLPRQRMIDAERLPDVAARFHQAELAHTMLAQAGYQPIGFDHFALPGDAIAIAAREGRLRRNFQGFTEDQADVLLGLGASAISAFRGALLQNEKNTGRYQMRVGANGCATTRGLLRSADDQAHGAAIEKLLCSGRADLSGLTDLTAIRARVAPYVARGLARWGGNMLQIEPDGLPYARSIAAALDRYRAEGAHRFSSAV